jgi:hypothetical protein
MYKKTNISKELNKNSNYIHFRIITLSGLIFLSICFMNSLVCNKSQSDHSAAVSNSETVCDKDNCSKGINPSENNADEIVS